MRTPTIVPGSVVVGYDRTNAAARALRWAARQASLENRTLTVVHVITPSAAYPVSAMGAGYIDPGLVSEGLAEDGARQVDEARELLTQEYPDLEVATLVVEGAVPQVLVDLSPTAASVVVGSHGRGRLASLLLGSVGVDVSRSASCPVFVVRPHHPGVVRRGILVGTDCGPSSRHTLEFAFREASLRRLPLTVVYCIAEIDGPEDSILDDLTSGIEEPRRMLAESIAGMTEQFPDVSVRPVIGNGSPQEVLVRASKLMDLVVVGHHQGPAFGDLIGLGSYAPSVVERSACPVAVVCEPAVAEVPTS